MDTSSTFPNLSVTDNDERIGTRVGNYELQRTIGYGANSQVFQACDLRSGECVALKLFTAPRPGDGFVREAGVGFGLKHPNLMAAIDLGYADANTRFVTYELAEGGSLRHRMRDGNLDVAFIRHVILEVARALAALHSRAIVHRDLKPENILLTDDSAYPRIRLADLGTSEFVRHDIARGMGGSPAYIAPEQINGECDTRADIYALGVLATEMLLGKRPFTGAVIDILNGHLQKMPDLAGLDVGVGEVLHRALMKNPVNRYQTVYDFVRDFDLSLSTELETIHYVFGQSPQNVLAQDLIAHWQVVRHGDDVQVEGEGAPAGQFALGTNGVAAVCASSPFQLALRDDKTFIAGVGENSVRIESSLYGLPPVIALRRFAGDVITNDGGAASALIIRQVDGTILRKVPLPFPLMTTAVRIGPEGEEIIGVDVQQQWIVVLSLQKNAPRPVILKAPEVLVSLKTYGDKAWVNTTSQKTFEIVGNRPDTAALVLE